MFPGNNGSYVSWGIYFEGKQQKMLIPYEWATENQVKAISG